MPHTEEEIEIRSDEVQEVLSSVPHWMIRWGITVIFGIILSIIGLAYLIKYPDVIKGTVVLTTHTPPSKLVTKTNGEIAALFVADKQEVKKGQVIAQIKNTVSKDQIDYLTATIQEVEKGVANEFKTPLFFDDNNRVFGALQADYNNLKNAVNEYMLSLNTEQFTKRKTILKQQILNYEKLDQISNQQFIYKQESYKRAEESYQSNKKLYDQNVISKAEFYQQEEAFNQIKNDIENVKKTNIQNQITLTDYQKQLNELEFEFLNKKQALTKTIQISIGNIKNQIANWTETYELKSTIDGRVNYLDQLSEYQFVEAGKSLFAIVPAAENDYVGYITIDKRGYGKIEVGQEVRIKFDNFPYNEYGQVKGKVEKISLIPNENQYTVQIALNNGLRTTYNKELVYTPEMSGQADIVTKDLRVIERIFNQFRKIFDD